MDKLFRLMHSAQREITGATLGVLMRSARRGAAAFGVTRLDRIITVGTEIKYRKALIFGFAPLLTYTYTKSYSSISIFEYERHQVEFGFTREL